MKESGMEASVWKFVSLLAVVLIAIKLILIEADDVIRLFKRLFE